MFCLNCGAQSNENTKFCGKCGSSMQQENQVEHGAFQQSKTLRQQFENAENQSQTAEQAPRGKKWLPLWGLGVVFAFGVGVALLVSGSFDADHRTGEAPESSEVVELEPITEEESADEAEYETESEPEDEISDERANLTGNIGLAEDDVFVMVNSDGYFGMLNGAGEVVVPFEFSNLSSSYYFGGVNYYFKMKYDESGRHGPYTTFYVLDDGGNIVVRSEGHRLEMSVDGIIHTGFWNEDRVSRVWDLSGDILFSMNDAVFSPEGFSNGLAAISLEDPDPDWFYVTYFGGYVDLHGNVVVGSEYEVGTSFDIAGEAAVRRSTDEDWIIINENGDRVRDIPNSSDIFSLSDFSASGVAVAREVFFDEEDNYSGSQVGLINKDGDRATEFIYSGQRTCRFWVYGFAPLNRAGLTILTKSVEESWYRVIINEHGEIIKSIPGGGEYPDFRLFSYNPSGGSRLIHTVLSTAGEVPRYGVIGIDGEEVLPPEFLGVWPMNDDRWILVQSEEKSGIKDIEGNWLFIYEADR